MLSGYLKSSFTTAATQLEVGHEEGDSGFVEGDSGFVPAPEMEMIRHLRGLSFDQLFLKWDSGEVSVPSSGRSGPDFGHG